MVQTLEPETLSPGQKGINDLTTGDIPKHRFLTQRRCFHQKSGFFSKTVLSYRLNI